MSKLILSCDGGGIRGAATAQFLTHIEDKLKADHNCSLRDCVDFYAGTSTGSLIAIALATTHLSVSAISNLYSHDNAEKIFARNRGWFEVDGVNAPKYEASGKTQLLQANMGSARIGNVPNDKHVLAVSYGIEKRKPEVIKSTNPTHRNLYSYDVADASSA
ncbi:MAG: patatin, partial [Merismopedia sp. SIO2A8]|nr:patatin [Merismopedia sp. SIO2A8]